MEKYEDLISRQAAIKAFDDEKYDNPFCSEYEVGYNDGIDFAVSMLSDLPPTLPEQKNGKWNFIGDNMFECTCCGVVYTMKQLEVLSNYNADPYFPRFCPNCGSYNGEESNNA